MEWTVKELHATEHPGSHGPRDEFVQCKKQAAYLKEHNHIAVISSLIALTAHALQMVWVIGQPLSSLLFRCPPIRDAIREKDGINHEAFD